MHAYKINEIDFVDLAPKKKKEKKNQFHILWQN